MDPIPNHMMDPIPDCTMDPIPDRMMDPIPDRTMDPIPDHTMDPIPDHTMDPIPDRTMDPIPDRTIPDYMMDPIPDCTIDPIPDHMMDPILGRTMDPIPDRMMDPIPDCTMDPNPDRTMDPIPDCTIPDHMMDPIPDNMTDLILDNADLPYAAKHPILLPQSHHYTGLVVRGAHIRVCHNGIKETLTEVRSRRYCVIKGRSLTRSLVHRCTTCRRYDGAPFCGPPPPPLPKFRVKDDPAFTYTGVDFAGPIFVQSEVSSSSVKVWICVSTCLVTRAVHLDIVCDLYAGTVLRCLKRFAARRGLPRKFLSDNGKTFQAAAKLLYAVFKDPTVQEYLTAQGCQWISNVAYAPWWGGVFERMVRSTKRCLRKMIRRASFTRDELLTAVVEIEAVINSRPLSYVSAMDVEEPLTPSHLLVGRRILSLPDYLGHMCEPSDEDFEVSASQLTKRMKHLVSVLNHFWRRWKSEYLSELRESHRHGAKNARNTHIAAGEVVIIHDDSLPCGLWKLGWIRK